MRNKCKISNRRCYAYIQVQVGFWFMRMSGGLLWLSCQLIWPFLPTLLPSLKVARIF